MTSHPRAIADAIREIPVSWSDAAELHAFLVHLPDLARACAKFHRRFADSLEATAVRQAFAGVIREAASRCDIAAEKLADAIGTGLLADAPDCGVPGSLAAAIEALEGASWDWGAPKRNWARPWVTGPAPLPRVITVNPPKSGFPRGGLAPSPAPDTGKPTHLNESHPLPPAPGPLRKLPRGWRPPDRDTRSRIPEHRPVLTPAHYGLRRPGEPPPSRASEHRRRRARRALKRAMWRERWRYWTSIF